MRSTVCTALALFAALLAACPHDFTRQSGDNGVPDAPAAEGGLDLRDSDSAPDAPITPTDIYVPGEVGPDMGCPLPCVRTLASGLNGPTDVAVSSPGVVYVTTWYDDQVWVVSASQATVFAGSGIAGHQDGPAKTAKFDGPEGVAVDANGTVYVADTGNHRIRVITSQAGTTMVDTLAGGSAGYLDGPADTAKFAHPTGVAVDSDGTVYVADEENHRIRSISNDEVVTVAGDGFYGWRDGSALTAEFKRPTKIAVDSKKNLYVVEELGSRVRVISGGTVKTLAGDGSYGFQDGSGLQAKFYGPAGIAVDAAGVLYLGDSGNQRVRTVDTTVTPAAVDTLAGSGGIGHLDGQALSALFTDPRGVAVDSAGMVYVADYWNDAVRVVERK